MLFSPGRGVQITNLAKIGDGHEKSPTVVVGDHNKKLIKNRGILKPSWAYVETNHQD